MKDIPSSQFFIQVDEEGYFKQGDLRVTDESYGRELFTQLRRAENGSYITATETASQRREILVEAFDEPFVGLQVSKPSVTSKTAWTLHLPYGFETSFQLSQLTLDEWDRFHGTTQNDIPFVFSRAAQAEFFKLLRDYDDDSITDSNGERFLIPPWLGAKAKVSDAAFWSERYISTSNPPWDLEGPHPALNSILPQLKLPRGRILVLGCGKGHDAAFLAKQGHIVTGIDFSEEALEFANATYGKIPQLTFEKQDFFRLPAHFQKSFDLVFEHTCYCAIEPQKRSDLVKVWRQCLTDEGQILGIFFAVDRIDGPPYGGTEWELRERTKKFFRPLYWTRWKTSPPNRQGKEVVIFAQKKDS